MLAVSVEGRTGVGGPDPSPPVLLGASCHSSCFAPTEPGVGDEACPSPGPPAPPGKAVWGSPGKAVLGSPGKAVWGSPISHTLSLINNKGNIGYHLLTHFYHG